MDNRFQFVLLTARTAALATSLFCAPALLAQEESSGSMDISDINNEVISVGVFAGIVNVQDFTSEFAPGLSATFRASEDFFIQYNYLEFDVSLSSYESYEGSSGPFFTGDDRTFRHYDLLIGYNLFQGEFFPSPTASLSTLYTVAGVGNTEFGGESKLTYTLGLGYEVALTRKISAHIDFRDYIYQSSLVSDEKRMVHTTQISIGAKYWF